MQKKMKKGVDKGKRVGYKTNHRPRYGNVEREGECGSARMELLSDDVFGERVAVIKNRI